MKFLHGTVRRLCGGDTMAIKVGDTVRIVSSGTIHIGETGKVLGKSSLGGRIRLTVSLPSRANPCRRVPISFYVSEVELVNGNDVGVKAQPTPLMVARKTRDRLNSVIADLITWVDPDDEYLEDEGLDPGIEDLANSILADLFPIRDRLCVIIKEMETQK